jgi:pyruvate dehydrogenase E1 component alpha subunit
MFGKATGLGKGKGGHMHLFDPVSRFSCSGIIGASLPPACGAALAAKKLGKDWVAVAFFGEGAANQGAVHESLNLAALWKLPVIFVCEDNKWAISVPKSSATSIEWVADRAAGYGMPGIKVATNDAMAVYEVAGPAIARARRGDGPSLIEVKTDRYLGHFQGDPEVYRPKDEVANLRKNDPIPRMASRLKLQGYMNDAEEAHLVALARHRACADVKRQPFLDMRRQLAFQIDRGHGLLEVPYLQHFFVHPQFCLFACLHGSLLFEKTNGWAYGCQTGRKTAPQHSLLTIRPCALSPLNPVP